MARAFEIPAGSDLKAKSAVGQKLMSNRPLPSSALTSTADITHEGCEVRKVSIAEVVTGMIPSNLTLLAAAAVAPTCLPPLLLSANRGA
jgi:hypothetical protein